MNYDVLDRISYGALNPENIRIDRQPPVVDPMALLDTVLKSRPEGHIRYNE